MTQNEFQSWMEERGMVSWSTESLERLYSGIAQLAETGSTKVGYITNGRRVAVGPTGCKYRAKESDRKASVERGSDSVILFSKELEPFLKAFIDSKKV